MARLYSAKVNLKHDEPEASATVASLEAVANTSGFSCQTVKTAVVEYIFLIGSQMNQLDLYSPTVRALLVARGKYCRHLGSNRFETWVEMTNRVIDHQRWLWERQLDRKLRNQEEDELNEYKQLMLTRHSLPAGRTLWLGGTELVKRREASMFNCSHSRAETLYDVVDLFWLLLQGCGVGFTPKTGCLFGFARTIPELVVIRSTRTKKGGSSLNKETWNNETKTWTIQVGDSAEAWAKSVGKLLSNKFPAKTLVLDYSEVRPEGDRLSGYGWISSGDEPLYKAMAAIYHILNRRAGQMLRRRDIHDIVNWLGTTLSSRRSAEIALADFGDSSWKEFASFKKDYFKNSEDNKHVPKMKVIKGDSISWERVYPENNSHRSQSNNTLKFHEEPTDKDLGDFFDMMVESGGSDPGLLNYKHCLERAPYFSGVNPCSEILLGQGSFCNLTETDVAKFRGRSSELQRALWLSARANYRQTCVNLQDGILQQSWHTNNQMLRLCGVGITGIYLRPDLTKYDYRTLRYSAVSGARSMADELNLPYPCNVTTVKPSGTLSKVMDTTEGMHGPEGQFIFNYIIYSKSDELLPYLRDAGYEIRQHYRDSNSVIVNFPVSYSGGNFSSYKGLNVNLESAISQMERCTMLNENWSDHSTSNTIKYKMEEIPEMKRWLKNNWNRVVCFAFQFASDPTLTAEEQGHPYLPQQVVTKEAYESYISGLKALDVDAILGGGSSVEDKCARGICPVN